MNCNCVEEVPKSVIGHLVKNKKVTSAKLKELSFQISGGKLTAFTNSTMICHLEGAKGVREVTFAHSFCPFCGQKIELETKPISKPADPAAQTTQR